MSRRTTLGRPASPVLALAGSILAAATASADVLNVPADFATIQAAIDAAVDGDEVLIAPGTYAVTGELLINNKAITLRGSGGAGVTTISTGSIFGLMQLFNVEADTVLDGLTLSGGTSIESSTGAITVIGGATIQNCIFRDHFNTSALDWNGNSDLFITNCQFIDNSELNGFGGAIEIGGSANITISGCTFTGNSAPNSSGGAIIGTAGVMLIEDCVFDGNDAGSAGGAISVGNAGGTTTVSNCQFIGNSAVVKGGAVFADGANISIVGCTFDNNDAATGGGAYLANGATATNCLYTNNTSSGAGAGLAVEDASAVNCTFTGNISSGDGGAMHVLGIASVLTDCDATGNTATGIGGGLHIAAGVEVTMQDSLLCNNTPDQIGSDGLLIAGNVVACDEFGGEPMGACCLPQGGCVLTMEVNCLAAGGTYQGDGTDCETAGCLPACPADSSGDGMIDIADLLAVLAGWGACP